MYRSIIELLTTQYPITRKDNYKIIYLINYINYQVLNYAVTATFKYFMSAKSLYGRLNG